jgi:hypothetical protein
LIFAANAELSSPAEVGELEYGCGSGQATVSHTMSDLRAEHRTLTPSCEAR